MDIENKKERKKRSEEQAKMLPTFYQSVRMGKVSLLISFKGPMKLLVGYS